MYMKIHPKYSILVSAKANSLVVEELEGLVEVLVKCLYIVRGFSGGLVK